MTRNWKKISGRKVAMMLAAAVVGFGSLGMAPAKAEARERFEDRRPMPGRFDRDRRDFDRDHRYGGNVRMGVRIDLGRQDVALTQRQFVPAVYEDRPVQVWVEPVVQKVCEKVWVPDRFEDRVIQRRHGWRIIEERQRVLVERGHYVEQWHDVVVTPGHYETQMQRVEVCAAHWEDRPVVGIGW